MTAPKLSEAARKAARSIIGWLRYDDSIPTAHADCLPEEEPYDETCEMLSEMEDAYEEGC